MQNLRNTPITIIEEEVLLVSLPVSISVTIPDNQPVVTTTESTIVTSNILSSDTILDKALDKEFSQAVLFSSIPESSSLEPTGISITVPDTEEQEQVIPEALVPSELEAPEEILEQVPTQEKAIL